MLKIKCPFCGVRDEFEFSCGGEAHIVRPTTDLKLTDKIFSEYLFMKYNPKGVLPLIEPAEPSYIGMFVAIVILYI